MPHLISNLYEKNYTPLVAKLAPRDLCNRPLMGRQKQKGTRLGADPTWKAMWRLIRTWVTHNHKLYYTYVLGTALGVYTFWWHACIGYYRQRNHHRTMEYAVNAEKEWLVNKPPEEDDDDEEEDE